VWILQANGLGLQNPHVLIQKINQQLKMQQPIDHCFSPDA